MTKASGSAAGSGEDAREYVPGPTLVRLLGVRRQRIEREPFRRSHVRSGPHCIRCRGGGPVVEDQVPGSVGERLDLGKRRMRLETSLLAQDPPCGRVRMLAFGEVVVGEEPAALTVVARDVLIPHEENAVVRDDGDEFDCHGGSIADVGPQSSRSSAW